MSSSPMMITTVSFAFSSAMDCRQLDVLVVRQHFDIRRVHEQEEHQDREDVHQRNEVQRATRLVALVVRDPFVLHDVT